VSFECIEKRKISVNAYFQFFFLATLTFLQSTSLSASSAAHGSLLPKKETAPPNEFSAEFAVFLARQALGRTLYTRQLSPSIKLGADAIVGRVWRDQDGSSGSTLTTVAHGHAGYRKGDVAVGLSAGGGIARQAQASSLGFNLVAAVDWGEDSAGNKNQTTTIRGGILNGAVDGNRFSSTAVELSHRFNLGTDWTLAGAFGLRTASELRGFPLIKVSAHSFEGFSGISVRGVLTSHFGARIGWQAGHSDEVIARVQVARTTWERPIALPVELGLAHKLSESLTITPKYELTLQGADRSSCFYTQIAASF
jgi:hypothetical protein